MGGFSFSPGRSSWVRLSSWRGGYSVDTTVRVARGEVELSGVEPRRVLRRLSAEGENRTRRIDGLMFCRIDTSVAINPEATGRSGAGGRNSTGPGQPDQTYLT